jgi:hypothetical protein
MVIGIILWIAILVIVIGIIMEADNLWGDGSYFWGTWILGIFIVLIGHVTCLALFKTTFTYENKPIEFQQIEGEYFTPQGNDYVVKIDGKIKAYPKSKFYTVQSDSVYNEIQIATGVYNYGKFDKWMIGKQKNDTTYHVEKFILYRNLN